MTAVGIKRIRPYAPQGRLTPEHFRAAWGARVKTTRAVANYDEDPLTMAVAAALPIVDAEGEDRGRIGGLYFASTRSPFGEKGACPLLAAATDLPNAVFSGEFVGSLRGATQALRAAWDALRAGSAEEALVAAADIRLVQPGDALEPALGDGAAAVILGKEDLLAEIVAARAHLEEFPDVWRGEEDPYLHQGDPKFTGDYGYARMLKIAVEALLGETGLKREDIAHLALYTPDSRALAGLAKALGFPPEKLAGGAALDALGNTGAASPLLALCDALCRAKPGERIVLAGYGGGADAILLRACEGVEARRAEFDLAPLIAGGAPLASYARYLQYRGMLPVERINPFTSLPVLWREQRALVRLRGDRCAACGTLQYPPRRICRKCSAKDKFEEARLSRRGVVYTFTRDHLVPGPHDAVAMISADMEGGGRFYGQFTDADPAAVKIGMPVELVFRKLHEGEGLDHYFWKFRPREA